ncbi:MAG: Coenzyme F420 hydrogenase/dehydrogenase, beta subunit C-terminal domain [Deltaproteobacteria bacterium]|nr:Coenzyme F420 hydrogenase/dehydrogenase, beta subunit C-terminal domain [Deltaproteobacteria bacterium]
MAKTAKIVVENQNPLAALQGFLQSLLEDTEITAILVPHHLPGNNAVMPMLVTDPQQLDRAGPLAPVFPVNAAKIVSKLTRTPPGQKMAVVLRPCEIRAFVELTKLNQGSMEEVMIIGLDCLGAYETENYSQFVEANQGDGFEASLRFYQNFIEGRGAEGQNFNVAKACQACEHPSPDNADISIGLIGVDLQNGLPVMANTARGEQYLDKLNLPQTEEPEERKQALAELIKKRIEYRDRMFEETREATSSLEKLATYLSGCVNCYNCRVACPVCYCRECVFLTDIFDHKPWQYLGWAEQKGALKMPTDTLFYHVTRLTHMSLSCVGCGKCSSACPNHIPVMELFRMVAADVQHAFDYEAGRSLSEPPPLSLFQEDEFTEITETLE